MVEQDPHDFLGNVAVDQPASEGVPPLVGGQVHRAAVFVTDLAGIQPGVEHAAVAVVGQWVLTADVSYQSRKQVRVTFGPSGRHSLLLGADFAFEFLIDRHGGLATHLVVEVAQIWGTLPVVEQAVESQGACVGGA